MWNVECSRFVHRVITVIVTLLVDSLCIEILRRKDISEKLPLKKRALVKVKSERLKTSSEFSLS